MGIQLSKADLFVKGVFLSGTSDLGCGVSLACHKPDILAALFLDTIVAFLYISLLNVKSVYRIQNLSSL